MSRCVYVHPDTGHRCLFEAGADGRYCSGCERLAFRERWAFEAWMQQVVLAMEAEYGLHPDDLPDCAYADWHATGLEPAEAAHQAIAICAGDDLAA
jgi:hypothetical protein